MNIPFINYFKSMFLEDDVESTNRIPESCDPRLGVPAPSEILGMSDFGTGSEFTGEKFPGALGRDFFDPEDLDIDDLRWYSSNYYNSNSIAHTLIDTKNMGTINRGLTLEAKPLSIILEKRGHKVPDDWGKDVEQRFDLWAGHKGCDYNFEQNFYQMQFEAFRHLLLKGKCVAIARYESDYKKGRIGRLNFQLLHVDQLCVPFEKRQIAVEKGGDIVDGFETDKTGTVVGMYVKTKKDQPLLNDKKNWKYIPRWGEKTGRPNFIFSIRKKGVGDICGMPDLTPIIHDLGITEKYRVAEIEAACVNASIALIQNSDGKNPNVDIFQNMSVGRKTDDGIKDCGNSVTETMINPGVRLWASQVGQNLTSFDTKRPNVNFGLFLDAVSRDVSASMGIPVEIVHKKFNNNYSASRAALHEWFRYVLKDRADYAVDFCQPVYELWLNDEIIFGRVKAEGWNVANKDEQILIRKAWTNADWPGMAKGSVDPWKENQAHALAEDRGWTTSEANSRELYGKNFDTNIDKREKEILRQQKLNPVQEKEKQEKTDE